MGLVQIGAIKIINSTVFNTRGSQTYNDNDSLYVYYDDGNGTVKVFLNPTDISATDDVGGTIQSDGNLLTQNDFDNGVFRVKSKRYSFCDDTTLNIFYNQSGNTWSSSFPYFPRRVFANSSSCPVDSEPSAVTVCDIRPVEAIPVNASSIGDSDGQIRLSVKTSDPSGVEYSFDEFTYGNGTDMTRGRLDSNGLYTYSVTISNLSSATYSIVVKDSRSCEYKFENIFVGYESKYIERAFFDFYDKEGNKYRFKINEKDYDSSSLEIAKLGGSPIVVDVGGVDRRSKFSNIYGTSITATIYSETENQYTDLFFGTDADPVTDKQFIGELYSDPNGSNELMHRGYFNAEEYSEPYITAPYTINLYFTDGLADLTSAQFPTYAGTQSCFDIIIECLNQTGLQNGIRIVSQTYPSEYYDASGNLSVDASTSVFHTLYVDRESYNGLNYNDVLDSIISSINPVVRLVSYAGYYWIIPVIADQSSYDYAQYDYQGNYDSSGAWSVRVDNGGARSSSSVFLNSSQNLTRDAVYKNIGVVEDRIVKGSVFNLFSEDNVIGDADGDILGTGFLGYDNVLNGDTGGWFVKTVNEKNKRDISARINRELIEETVLFPTAGYLSNGKPYRSLVEQQTLTKEKVSKAYLTYANILTETDNLFLNFDIPDGQGGDAYVITSAPLESDINDSFEFSFNYFIDFSDARKVIEIGEGASLALNTTVPFAVLRYAVIIQDSSGVDYYLNGVDWDTEQVINSLFVDAGDFQQVQSFSAQGTLPIDDPDCKVTVVIYDCDPYYDTNNGNVTIPSDYLSSTFNANGLGLGYKQILKTGDAQLSYYSLQDPSAVTGTSINALNSDYVWVYEGTAELQILTQRVPNTRFAVNNISFSTLPDGKQFDERPKKSKTGSQDNVYDYEYPVYHFDLRGLQNNERGMILNYWQDASGNPIDGWGDQNKIGQDLILDELVGQYKAPKKKINMELEYFIPINVTNTLRVTYDSNTLFKFNTYSQDIRMRKVSGEIVEIGKDGQVISVGEYSSAFSNAFNI